MKNISMNGMMQALYKIEAEKGVKATLLGIGPMSKTLIEATLSLAMEKDFPIMFIASRNQIDAAEFGRGYVCNWDQIDFANAVNEIKKSIGFDGLCYLCRDHGGPWQRDKERSDKLPADEAMAIAKRSYKADIEAGFDLLHIDPTKDPHVSGVVPMDSVLTRTVELIEYAEQERVALNLPPVAYEVGTEETNGGLTDESAYAEFIGKLADMLAAKHLPMPLFIVGQTGTLTRLTENVGHFDALSAQRLSKEARKYGVGIKEHNGDYLSETILCMHPALGVTSANVAPEYGVAETAAYLILADMEQQYAKLGMVEKASDFYTVIREATVRSERWRKWLMGDDAVKPVDTVLADDTLSGLITRVGGHYTFETPAVKDEMAKMFANLVSVGIDPHKTVIDYIKRALQRYIDCFNLTGLTSKIKAAL